MVIHYNTKLTNLTIFQKQKWPNNMIRDHCGPEGLLFTSLGISICGAARSSDQGDLYR